MTIRAMVTGAAWLALCAGASASVTIVPIALTGHDDAMGPGEGAGIQFGQGVNGSLGSATACINLSGDVVFRCADNMATPVEGVWRHSAATGTNTAIAMVGWSVGPTYIYWGSGFNFPLINDAGQTAWRFGTVALFGDNGSGPAVDAATAANWSSFYAPDTGNATIASFSFPAPLLNSAGDNAFVSQLTVGSGNPVVTISSAGHTTDNAYGVWSGNPGDTHLRIRQNDLYPGTVEADDLRIGNFQTTTSYVSFNGSGQILLGVSLQGTVDTTAASGTNGSLLKYTPGSGVSVVARRGDPAPGSSGEFYSGLATNSSTTPPGPTVPNANSDMNDAGQLVFSSRLRNAATGGTQTTGWALFTNASGPLTMVARGTDAMPAISGANGSEFVGVNWGEFSNYNLINHSGTILFDNSGMTGAGINPSYNSSGLFKRDSSGVITKVMRLTDLAPAVSTTGGAVTFNSLQGSPAFNALGQVVFYAGLSSTDGGVSGLTGNNFGLFAVDAHGTISLIAQKNTGFQVAPGDVRAVASIGGVNASGGDDGRATSLNDNGQFVFSLSFTDGSSGVFIATIPTCGSADFNCDGDVGTDADIEAFFACLAGNCPSMPCRNNADFNADGDVGTDADIEAFFRVLGGGSC